MNPVKWIDTRANVSIKFSEHVVYLEHSLLQYKSQGGDCMEQAEMTANIPLNTS
jgi:hypothetical protein